MVIAVAASGFALYSFDRYRTGFDALVSSKLPAVAAASELAQQSEKFSASAPALAAVEFGIREKIHHANDATERRAQLVADGGEELVLMLDGACELEVGVAEFSRPLNHALFEFAV